MTVNSDGDDVGLDTDLDMGQLTAMLSQDILLLCAPA